MEGFRSETRDAAAYVALEACKAEGAPVRYQDRATSPPVWLWAVPGQERMELARGQALEEQLTRRSFSIPRQGGCPCGLPECGCGLEEVPLFPPQFEPSSHAIIYYGDYEWSVDRWAADSVGACYVAETTRHVPRRAVTE